jgi:cobalt-zinc-cadmium efflux system protein
MGHHHHHEMTSAATLGWTILLNIGITAAETVGGILSGSLALLSDAGHNFSDVVALILAFFGARGAALQPTLRSTYGFKRLEVLTAIVNALGLVGIALIIIFEAFRRYAHPQEINATVMLTVAALGLIGNLLSVWILRRRRNETINMRAAFLHMWYDTVSSVAVIGGGIIIIFTGAYLVDLILSVVIAAMILWSSLDIIKEAGGIFMEAAPSHIDVNQVAASIASCPRVCDVHHLHVWSISSRETALSCHIAIAGEDLPHLPEIIRDIYAILQQKHGIGHATIQPEMDTCPEQPILSPFSTSDHKDQ